MFFPSDCDAEFEKLAGSAVHPCFHKGSYPRFPELVLQARDPANQGTFSGLKIDWNNWDTFMSDFICRCAKRVKQKGYKVFGIQNYGKF